MTREPLGLLCRAGEAALKAAGVETPGLDARVLLAHCTGTDYATFIAEPGCEVEADGFRAAIARRAAGEPVSRIIGEREFYGLSFRVTSAVLDPRADTETLVAAALALPWMRFADLGTGSGAIAVALLHERPGATGASSDTSSEALAVARENALRHGVADRLTFVEGDWFAPLDGRFDLIVSNPPYIPEAAIAGLMPEVRAHDPHLALSGGADGLDAYRSIACGLRAHLAQGGHALFEIGAGQEAGVTAIFEAAGFRFDAGYPDLGGHLRVLGFS